LMYSDKSSASRLVRVVTRTRSFLLARISLQVIRMLSLPLALHVFHDSRAYNGRLGDIFSLRFPLYHSSNLAGYNYIHPDAFFHLSVLWCALGVDNSTPYAIVTTQHTQGDTT
jgi:hypothetical protein